MTQDLEKHTVRLHRVFKAPADVVYRAFIEPDAKCKWLPPYGYVAEMHQSEEKVGGKYRMSFKHFRSGQAHSFSGTFLELKPHERIRYTDTFDSPGLPGEMKITVTFREVLCGTEVTIVQSEIPEQIPVEMCYLGWQESLMQLATLVDPDIPQE